MRTFFRNLPDKDRRLVFFVTVGALILSTLPYLVGLILAGRNFTFLGLCPLGPADTNVYFSFIRQAMHGVVFVQNLHTGEPQAGSLFHPLWLLLGWLAAIFRLTPALIFHLARVFLGGVFLLFFYYFLSYIFPDSRRRNIAFVLAAFSSGIGVFFSYGLSGWNNTQLFFLLPADQWITEGNTFLTLLHSPLFVMSQLMLLILFWCFLREEHIKRFFLVGGLFSLFVLMHPYDLVTVAAVLPVFAVVRLMRDPIFTVQAFRRSMKRIVLLGLCAIPPLAAFLVGAHIEPAIGGWVKQNVTISPMPHSYIIGYGFILLFAVPGFVALRKTRVPAQLLVLTWAIVSIILIYAPFQFNRRMTNGFHLALVILAAVGIDLLWSWLQARMPSDTMRRTMVAALIAWLLGFGFFLTTLVIVVKSIYYETWQSGTIYFLPKSVAAGMDWLGTHANRDDVILSHSYDGNILPARTGLRVYIGHGHQTVDWDRKLALVNTWFFRTNNDDPAKAQFLHDNGITYVFFSSVEDAIGTYTPETKTYLTPVFRNSGVTIYRVLPAAPEAID